jgi:hypothetical protein
LRHYVVECLSKRWSPQQVCRALKKRFPEEKHRHLARPRATPSVFANVVPGHRHWRRGRQSAQAPRRRGQAERGPGARQFRSREGSSAGRRRGTPLILAREHLSFTGAPGPPRSSAAGGLGFGRRIWAPHSLSNHENFRPVAVQPTGLPQPPGAHLPQHFRRPGSGRPDGLPEPADRKSPVPRHASNTGLYVDPHAPHHARTCPALIYPSKPAVSKSENARTVLRM